MQELDLSKLSPEERASIIRKQELSGLTQRLYCNKHNISRTKFSYWKLKYNNAAKKPSFQEVTYTENLLYLELILPNMLILKLKLTDIKLLKELLPLIGGLDVNHTK